jgi:hypothetical protein
MTMLDTRPDNVVVALQPVSADAAAHEVVGEIIDLAGYNGCAFVLFFGLITAGGSVTWKLYHDDAIGMGTEAEVSTEALGLQGTCTAWADTDDITCKTIGYKGMKRYVRIKITTVAASAKAYGAVCIRGYPRD